MTRPYKRGPLCSHCDEPRLGHHPYCVVHKRAYQREWAAMRRRRLKQLEAMVHGVSVETLDIAAVVRAGSAK